MRGGVEGRRRGPRVVGEARALEGRAASAANHGRGARATSYLKSNPGAATWSRGARLGFTEKEDSEARRRRRAILEPEDGVDGGGPLVVLGAAGEEGVVGVVVAD